MQDKAKKYNGAGTIKLRSDGRYEAQIRVDGKRKSVYGKNENEVNRKLKKLRQILFRGEVVVKKIKFENYVEEWMLTYKKPMLKDPSYDRLESTFLNHVKGNKIGNLQMGNITTKDLQLLINEKSAGLSYSSIKKIYELLNACLKHAVLIKEIPNNIMDGVTLPLESNLVVKTKKMDTFSVEEIRKIYEISNLLDKNGNLIYSYGQATIILLNTGMRCGELMALKWSNVSFEKKTILVDESIGYIKNRDYQGDGDKKRIRVEGGVKTVNGDRNIPLNNVCMDALEKIQKHNEIRAVKSEYVICTNTGKPVTYTNLSRGFKCVLKKAGVELTSLHTTRHSFASQLLRKEPNISIVSELLGHGSPSITYNTYIHNDNSDKMKSVEKLNSLSFPE